MFQIATWPPAAGAAYRSSAPSRSERDSWATGALTALMHTYTHIRRRNMLMYWLSQSCVLFRSVHNTDYIKKVSFSREVWSRGLCSAYILECICNTKCIMHSLQYVVHVELQRGGKYPVNFWKLSKNSWKIPKNPGKFPKISGMFPKFIGNFQPFCNPKYKECRMHIRA